MNNIFSLFTALITVACLCACNRTSSNHNEHAPSPANTDLAYLGTWIITHDCSTKVSFSDTGCTRSKSLGWTYEYTKSQVKYVGLSDNCTAISNFTTVGNNPWIFTSTIVSVSKNCRWKLGDVNVYTLEVGADGLHMMRINKAQTQKWFLKPYAGYEA